MRTTVVIDDDVLAAAKAIARQRKLTIGKVVSELARRALHPPAPASERDGLARLPLRKAGAIVTEDIVNALRDEGP